MYPIELKKECVRLCEKYGLAEDSVKAAEWVDSCEQEKALLFPFIEMIITNKCNLKCRYCSNLIPHYSAGVHETFDTVKKWIDLICERAKKVFRLKIHGGEPLLHPDLARIIKYACGKENIVDVRMSTNGTIIPSEELIHEMLNEKFRLHISDYSATCGINHQRLTDVLDTAGINYYVMKNEPWQDLGEIVSNNMDNVELAGMVLECNMHKCSSFYNGKLYVCSRASNGDRLGLVKALKDDYLDFENGFGIDEYYKFFRKLNFSACRMCHGAIKGKNEIPAGEQL